MSLLFQTIKNCTFCHLRSNNEKLPPTPGRGVNGQYFIVALSPSWSRIKLDKANDVIMPFYDKKYTSYWLGKVLTEIKWPLEETYITNLIKCSLPHNRVPTEKDFVSCYKLYFLQEIYIYTPKLIICLGNTAYEFLQEGIDFIEAPIEKVFHHSYIARTPDKYGDWKMQWEKVLKEYEIKA